MKRAIGLAALTVLELAHHEQISVAAQAGYSHVGLRLVPVAGQPYEHPLDLPEVERRLADTGVRVLDVEVFRLTPDTRVEQWAGVLEISARLQATELLVHGADPDQARLIETFGRLCELAGRYGLRANLEPMPWVDVSNIATALRILRSAGRANGGLLVDAIHFFRAVIGLAGVRNQVQRAPLAIASSGCAMRPDAMTICVPACVAILAASILVCMPPRESSEPAAPAIASMPAVMYSTSGTSFAVAFSVGGES